MNASTDPSVQRSRDFAALMQSADCARLFRLMTSAGMINLAEPPPLAVPAMREPAEPPRIGIWERRIEKGETCFVRPEQHAERFAWANVTRIGPKRARRRVVLVGESVARGWFYDPEYTPAKILQEILTATAGAGEWEVVDLARTSLGFDVLELAISAHALQPNCVLMFCGNNWVNSLRQIPPWNSPTLCGAWELGLPTIKSAFERHLSEASEHVVGAISAFYRERHTPVAWIVPEYNLTDWVDPIASVPLPARGGSEAWLAHCAAALDALHAGRVEDAGRAAQAMIAIDGGTSSAAPGIIGASLQDTNSVAARAYLEAARDATAWDPQREWYPPRIHAVIQRVMRERARNAGDEVIDVPALLQETLGAKLADRTVFLDHCHLGARGMKIVMAAAAGALLRAAGNSATESQLSVSAPSPGRKVEAEAEFLAAIHNAHWWQPYEVILHHCRCAVAASDHIVPIMEHFLEMQATRSPRLMNRLAEKVIDAGTPIIGRYLGFTPLLAHRLETDLERAVRASVPHGSTEAARRIAAARAKQVPVPGLELDLLDYYYRAAAPQPKELTWSLRNRQKAWSAGDAALPDYLQALWPRSQFLFCGRADGPMLLRLTCRVPESRAGGSVSIYLNDHRLAELHVGTRWSSHEVLAAGNALRDGVNQLVLEWPTVEVDGAQRLACVAADTLAGWAPQPYVIFGEIYAFTARTRVVAGANMMECAPYYRDAVRRGTRNPAHLSIRG